MKKLTAGIFTVLIGLCAANSANAAVASKGYADAVAEAAQAAAEATAAADATTKADAAKAAAEATAKDALDAYKATQAGVDSTQNTNISDLTTLVGTLPTGVDGVTTVVQYIDKKTEGIATDTALQGLQSTVSTNTAAIDKINGDVSTPGSFAKAIADSINALSADEGAIKAVVDDLAAHELLAEQTYATKTDVSAELAKKANNATTLAGYGITDAYTTTQVDAELAKKANNATTLGGYGITDAYTKTQVDAKISNVAVADEDAQKVTAPSIEYAQSMIDESQAALEDDVEALQGLVGETAVSAQISTAVDALANGAVATNTSEISALKGTVNDTTKGVLANAQKAADNAAAIVTANGKITDLETTVNDATKGVLANAQKAADNAAAIAAHTTALESHTTAINDITNSDVMKSGITAAKVGVVDGINAGDITEAGKYVLTATVGEDGVVSDYKWEIIERSQPTGDEV